MSRYTKCLGGSFEGWTVSPCSNYLYDPDNNFYHIDEIRSIFATRQFMQSVVGSSHQRTVVTLKEYLDQKIQAVKTPVVTVDWGDGLQQQIRHPIYG